MGDDYERRTTRQGTRFTDPGYGPTKLHVNVAELGCQCAGCQAVRRAIARAEARRAERGES